MFDLATLSLEDTYRCSADVRGLGEEATDEQDAAERIVSYFFDQLQTPAACAYECCLVRLFRTRPLSSLSARDASQVSRALGEDAKPSTPCLMLAATRGARPEWNDPSQSRAHRLVPLSPAPALRRLPMVEALVSRLGVPAGLLSGSAAALDDPLPLFDVFHVEHARGSAFVPDQANFVEPCGVRSVLGFGGVLPPGQVFVVILFSRVDIPPATADLFRIIAPSVGLALLTPEGSAPHAVRLQAYERIVRYHERLALDGQRRLQEEASQLDEARIEAQSASRAKDEFLARLGHELRNPLAPIATAAQLLNRRGETCRELQIIERQATHLARLVDDLLDVSRIVRGKVEVDRRPVEMASVVGRAGEAARPLFQQRKQVLTLRVPAQGLLIDADLGRLTQVVSNLLDNASKYSPAGSEVVVSATRVDDRVRLSVRDKGMGIEPEMLQAVFEPFVERRRPAIHGAPGLGLGLKIVRSLVELHDGSIRAFSAGPGQGSEFVVDLPLAVPGATGEAVTTAPPLGCPERLEGLAAVDAACRRRILLVDDNADAASTLGEALSALGHEVSVATDGQRAVEVASDFHPQVAILDIGMPGMDGYELARRLRGLPGLEKSMKIVAVTGYGQADDRQRSIEAGFVAHLVKPIALEALQRAVQT